MSAENIIRLAQHQREQRDSTDTGPDRRTENVERQSLEDVLATFQRWLYLPDPDVVLVVLGGVAANLLEGDPVWLVVVGPPGSGKSEVLQSTAWLRDIRPAATLTEPALLSGTSRKEHAHGAKGGLLRELGDFGILLCKDFGSVLNMQRDSRAGLLAALREVYDGSWTRHVGTDGGKTLHWHGKVGLLAGCTQTIDRHHAVMGAMGERFILYRLPETVAEEQASRSLAHFGHEAAMRSDLSRAVAGLFRDGLPTGPLPLTDQDRDRLVTLATLAVRCRSSVERDGYSREIELVPDPESPARLVKALARLLAGLRAIGVKDEDAWRIVTKCALDSIPALRLAVIDHLHGTGEQSTTQVAQAIGYPTTATRRTLEDLAAHHVADREANGKGKADTWRLTEWTSERYAAVLTVPEKSGDALYTTTPCVGRHFGNGSRIPNNDGGFGAISTSTRGVAETPETPPPDISGTVPDLSQPLADRIRQKAQTATCTCADGGEVNGDGRCQRCYGRLEVTK